MKTISIITPIHEPTNENLGITIKSLSEQTDKNFEWVIVFDGATDIPENYEEIKNASFPIKWAILGENYGPSVARNVGFNLSTGDIISYVDIGDELFPDRIERLHLIHDDYNIDLAFSNYIIREGNVDVIFNHNDLMRYFKVKEGTYLSVGLNHGNISIPLGVSHTRRPFVLAGGFQPGIVCGEDGILWRRMLPYIQEFAFSYYNAGRYYVNLTGQSRTQRRFDMGGFAFDAGNPEGSHGQYLDEDWFETFNSKELYDKVLTWE